MSAYSVVSVIVFQRHGHWKSMEATDIYVYDDLEPRLCFQIPWALAMQAITFYLAFAQYFVTLFRGGSRQAVPK